MAAAVVVASSKRRRPSGIDSQPFIASSTVVIRLERYPFPCLILVVDLILKGSHLMKSQRTPTPAAMDPVHETVDIFHTFFNRKINQKI
jgi:hypothetical protein